jgi:hypothetical protein
MQPIKSSSLPSCPAPLLLFEHFLKWQSLLHSVWVLPQPGGGGGGAPSQLVQGVRVDVLDEPKAGPGGGASSCPHRGQQDQAITAQTWQGVGVAKGKA